MNVTIGLPFYNSALTLKKTIMSILNQSYPDFELLLVDNKSTDNSLQIATSFLFDPRVKIIRNSCNLGLSKSLNIIIKEAYGDIIIRMDADDIMFPNRVMKIVQAFNENENCNIIGHSAIIINEKDQPIGIRKSPEHISLIECYNSTRFIHPTVAYRKTLLTNNLYNSKYDGCEDHELWFRIFSISNVKILDVALLFYREPSKLNFNTYFKRNLKLLSFIKDNKQSVGFIATIKATLFVYLKIFLYALSVLLKFDTFILRCRNRMLLDDEAINYQNILNDVIAKKNY
jgi:glycosyltransferase involved in cell wall biosynthesis